MSRNILIGDDSMIQWLHISDLHMKNTDDADQQNFYNTLLKDCCERRIRANFIVVTGDLHDFRSHNGYEATQLFLYKLTDVLGLNIEKDLFIIPGNHDVDADAELRQHLDWPSDQDSDYPHVSVTHPSLIQNLLKDFKGYRAMASALLPMYQANNSNYQDPASVHVRIWRNKINILHLNTALLSNGERDHAEAVDINSVCGEQIRLQLKNGLPTIVIGHHSFHDLYRSIKDRLVQAFNQTNVWAYLAGDKHQTNYQGDEYLIDRKIGINAWPNIVAGKTSAAIDDDYSEPGAVLYCWDELSTVTVTHLSWKSKNSGNSMTILKGDSERTFPMYRNMGSQLYYDLLERLIKIRERHPSFQLMQIDSELFPKAYGKLDACKVPSDINNSLEENYSLSDIFRESWSGATQNHLMLEGEGGIGKTVALLSLTTQEDLLPRHVPAVYIPLYALKTRETDDSIGKYILEETLFGDKCQYADLNKLANQKWDCGPQLILLLDGFNEISPEVRYVIARNIEDWSNKRGIQIITASRFDVCNYLPGLAGEFRPIKLQPLSHEQIQNHLQRNGIPVPPLESTLWAVIDYPLMLALYTKTEDLQSRRSSIPMKWRTPSNSGSIIWNYLQSELWRYQVRTKKYQSLINVTLATEYIAPYIAWRMVQNQRFFLTEQEFVDYIQEALEFINIIDKNDWPIHIQQVIRHVGGTYNLLDENVFFDVLTCELNLFRVRESSSDPMVSLMHQHFRDCLAAIHLLNSICKSKGDLPEIWQHPIDSYVLNFIADLLTVEEFNWLWEANRVLQPTNPTATRIMLELQKRLSGYDFSHLNFSGMDLRKVHFYPYREPHSSALLLPRENAQLNSTQVSEHTFEPEGHKDSIEAIVVSEKSNYSASISLDGTVRIWDIISGECLNILESSQLPISAVAITKDSKLCVSASWDMTLNVWDVFAGTCSHTLKGHKSMINSVAITSDGSRCVSASDDNTLRIWDLSSGDLIHVLNEHTSSVKIVEITDDGHFCVSASEDGMIYVWDMASNKPVCHFTGHSSSIKGMAIIEDSKCCVSSDEYTICKWDMFSGKCIHPFKNHIGVLGKIVFSTDGRYCISTALWDNTLNVIDMDSGICLRTLTGHNDHINDIIITPDNRICITASRDKTVRIWDVYSGKCLHILEHHNFGVDKIAVTADGNRCISASYCELYVWDINSGKCLHALDGKEPSIRKTEITKDGSRCISVSWHNTIRIWDTASGLCQYVLKDHTDTITCAAMAPNGSRFVTSSGDTTIRVWDVNSGKCLHILDKHKDYVKGIVITPNSNYCISTSWDGTLRIWDISSGIHAGECIYKIKKPVSNYFDVTITLDGTRCISEGDHYSLGIWNILTGEPVKTLTGHTNSIEATAVLPGDHYCISASIDNSIRVWDMLEGVCVLTLDGGDTAIRRLAALDEHRFICTYDEHEYVSEEGETNIMRDVVSYNLRIGDICTGTFLKVLKGHRSNIVDIAITKDGSRCISASLDHTLRIWDTSSGECLHILKGHTDSVNAVAIAKEGNCCVSASADGTLRIWNISSGECLKVLKPIYDLSLFGVDLSSGIITPPEYSEVLRQNGAKIPPIVL